LDGITFPPYVCRVIKNKITMQLTLDFNNTEKVNIWKRIISKMTNEEIERRSLLVSFCEPTKENNIFQALLTKEYNKRK